MIWIPFLDKQYIEKHWCMFAGPITMGKYARTALKYLILSLWRLPLSWYLSPSVSGSQFIYVNILTFADLSGTFGDLSMVYRTSVPKRDVLLDQDSLPISRIYIRNFGTHGFELNTASWNPIFVGAWLLSWSSWSPWLSQSPWSPWLSVHDYEWGKRLGHMAEVVFWKILEQEVLSYKLPF